MMGEVETAAIRLALVTLAFVAVALAVWWFRRPRAEPAAPKLPRTPRAAGESRLPRLQRKSREVEEVIEIAPARLARISGKTPVEPSEPYFTDEPAAPAPEATEAAPEAVEPAPAAPVVDEASLASAVSQVEEEAHRLESCAEAVSIRLVPQIPPRDAILTRSWLGGRPRLPHGMDWPHVDGRPGDFLAQIACTDLPAELWDGLGPRHGWLAFFSQPDTGAPLVLHLGEDGPPREPPRAAGDAYFGPYGGLRFGDLAPLAIRAFPEWPVEIVAVRPGEPDPRDTAGDPDALARALYVQGYDIADPAFHPFDWDSMQVMAQILERRLDRLPAEDAVDNTEVAGRAREIIAIVRESAGQGAFAQGDASAVMTALHTIRWTKTVYGTDPETGEESVETLVLPLTRHHPEAPLWVHDYQTILFDHAKHAWCRNPNSLSAPARAFFEPLWEDLAAHEMAAMGHVPFEYIHDFDDERDVVLIELPTSGLMSRIIGDGHNLVLTMRKADLAAGDFSKLRVQRGS